MLKATSTAPPPATIFPDSKVLLATQIESCNDLKLKINYLSTSSSIYSFAPLRIIVHALDFLHPLKNTKSLSPTASSLTSSHSPKNDGSKTYSPYGVAIVLITVAPVSLAILAISPLLTLLNPMHPASTIYFEAKSSMPILVRITLAPA